MTRLLAAAAVLLLALPAPSATPVCQCADACACGVKCPCAERGPCTKGCACSLSVSAPAKSDAERYAYLYAQAARGATAVMAVGVSPPHEYATQEQFPSGFLGIPDGVYDCYRGKDGKPEFTRRAAAGRWERQCDGAGCRLVWVPAK